MVDRLESFSKFGSYPVDRENKPGEAFAAFDFKGRTRIEFRVDENHSEQYGGPQRYVLYPSDHLLASLLNVLQKTGKLNELLKIEVK